MNNGGNATSLSNIKVLDFTGELGPYAAKLYASMGADVIHIEPVAGDPLRDVGPFYKGIPGKERGLQFLYYNADKRGMALDLENDAGKDIFIKLCESADILLESFVPGYLNDMGLSYDILSAVNPRLVQTSITPFGSTGPYKDFPGSDLTISALSGFLFLAGVENNKSVRICDNQAYRMAEANAAVGSSIALLFAKKTGIGQFVDVACMESVGMALENSAQYWDLEGKNRRGRGNEAGTGSIHPCKDGYVIPAAIMGKNKFMWDNFYAWMKKEEIEELEVFSDERWIDPGYRNTPEALDTFRRVFERFTMKHNKQDIYDRGQASRVAITPVSNGKDLLENPQLKHRKYFKTLRHDSLDADIVLPGGAFEFGSLEWRMSRPAPTLGQHTAEVLKEVGYAEDEIDAFAKEGVVHVG